MVRLVGMGEVVVTGVMQAMVAMAAMVVTEAMLGMAVQAVMGGPVVPVVQVAMERMVRPEVRLDSLVTVGTVVKGALVVQEAMAALLAL